MKSSIEKSGAGELDTEEGQGTTPAVPPLFLLASLKTPIRQRGNRGPDQGAGHGHTAPGCQTRPPTYSPGLPPNLHIEPVMLRDVRLWG